MECTQRLECTQDLYDSPVEKTCPEQIGFLGICGAKYPVMKGPNKIGRDPQTCSIVLQLESISRQHAVINILSKTEYMLMDLDSANKTKLSGRTLQPYIPQPLAHGDMLQFGKVFGVFRLLAEDAALPLTQALDATPAAPRPPATVPESPDVSDREDSFIAPSQPKLPKTFSIQQESNNFIKPAAKTISIQPIGSKKIDNVYWSSSKKSTSIGSTFDESNQSLNVSTVSVNKSDNTDLHEMETQAPTDDMRNVSADFIYTANTQMPNVSCRNTSRQSDAIHTADTQMPDMGRHNVSTDAIHTASTQLPNVCARNVSVDSIYTANTQAPDHSSSPSIHSLETQVTATENLPNVCKVNNQQEMNFDFCLANKENDISIFNAETQTAEALTVQKKNIFNKAEKSSKPQNECSKSSLHTSDEEIIFEDIDNEVFRDEFESQSLLPESPEKQSINKLAGNKTDPVKSVKEPATWLKSDSSTDCDDDEIAATQQLPARPPQDDLTDCEDDFSDDFKKTELSPAAFNQNPVFEDMLTQVLDDDLPKFNNATTTSKTNTVSLGAASSKIPFEDMLTQVIEEGQPSNVLANNDLHFEDIPTQIICDKKDEPEIANLHELQTQVLLNDIPDKVIEPKKISNEFISPFKVPLQSPRKSKRKEIPKVSKVKELNAIEHNCKKESSASEKDDKYYEATQDILDDLCTQRLSPGVSGGDDEVVPCSVEDDKIRDYKLPGLDYDVSPKSSDRSCESNIDDKLNQFVTSLSKEQIHDVIGVHPLKRQLSDLSDTEATPKKVRPVKFFETDLPNSQEIKTSVSLHYNSNVTGSSSESETEVDTEEQNTPILYRKKKKPKVNAKIDLSKKFDVDALPTRVLTRVSKPTLKVQGEEGAAQPRTFTSARDGDISNEIVIENITRLKNKNDQNKSSAEVNKKIKNESKIITSPEIESKPKKSKSRPDNKKELATETSDSTKDKRKSDDTNEDESKFKRNTRDKRKPDENKNNSNKSESSKRDKPIPTKSTSVSKLSKSKSQSGALSIDFNSERSKRSTRSTRTRNKEPDKEAASPDKDDDKQGKRDDDRKKRRSNRKNEKQESDVPEVRRSRRQKSYKEKKENDSLIKVKITKPVKKHAKRAQGQPEAEQSAVYSESAESGAESPRRRKRAAAAPLRAPSPKRTRAAPQALRVLFTAFPFPEVRSKLESLGAEVVSDVTQCSVLVSLCVKRTFKLLCAVGLGRPVVGAAWVQACADRNQLVDPWQYLLQDAPAEQRFGFSLARSLRGPRHFLRGYNVTSTPSVKPSTAEMMLIVECSGGAWRSGGPRWLVVSCGADRALWPELRARGATLVSSELVLGGVLRQQLDIAASKLA